MKAKVEGKQEKKKERHDQHAHAQEKPDDFVYVRNFSSNCNQQWLPGIILKHRGPVSYVVKLTDGRMFRRHQDHVRLRHDTGLETDRAAEFPVVRPTTVEVGPQETERQAEASGSSREDEHSHTEIQTLSVSLHQIHSKHQQ